jgi:Domain of unknown function (DUF4349)
MLNRTYRRTRRTARHARRPVTGRRRLAVAAPGLALITIATLAALAGCSGGASSESSVASAANGFAVNGAASSAAVSAPEAGAAPAAAASRAGNGQSTEADKLIATGQQLIYTASLTVRAHSVSAAVSRATAIAAGEGGYVSSENASNDPNHPDQSTATVELKIPVALYSAALHDLTQPSLGTQLSLQQQTQDVTEQVANVNSRVTSDEAAIAQLQSLLKHAGTIGGLLSVQEQINSQESDLEAMQAQQSSLNHETSYATVTLTVLGPRTVPKPAKQAHTPGLVNGLAAGWHAFRTSVSWLLAIVGAVAPFAAIIAAIAGLAYLGRRRFIRRGRRAGTAAAGSSADS